MFASLRTVAADPFEERKASRSSPQRAGSSFVGRFCFDCALGALVLGTWSVVLL